MEVSRDDLETLRSTGMSLMPTGLGDLGADVLDMALDQVRVPAGDAVDKIDSEIQSRIQERVQASKRSMMVGTLFAVFPLVVLLGLPKLL